MTPLGGDHGAALRGGAAQAPGLRLPVEQRALRGRDVDHQPEGGGGGLEQVEPVARAAAGVGAQQVDQAVADQEAVVAPRVPRQVAGVQEFPGQGEQGGVVGADLDDRARAVGADQCREPGGAGRVEQGAEEPPAQGAGLAEEVGARGAGRDGQALQAGIVEPGEAETGVGPGHRDLPGLALGVGDGERALVRGQDEDQVAPQDQAAAVGERQPGRVADDPQQCIGGACGIAVGGVDRQGGGQDSGEAHRVDAQRQQAPERAVTGHVAGPFLLHPGPLGGVLGDDQGQIPAPLQGVAQADDDVVARADVLAVEEDAQPQGLKPLGKRQDPGLVWRGVREEEVILAARRTVSGLVPVLGWGLGFRHGPLPRAWMVTGRLEH
nr:hypothetical protein [uncultured Thiodictyon sp.]